MMRFRDSDISLKNCVACIPENWEDRISELIIWHPLCRMYLSHTYPFMHFIWRVSGRMLRDISIINIEVEDFITSQRLSDNVWIIEWFNYQSSCAYAIPSGLLFLTIMVNCINIMHAAPRIMWIWCTREILISPFWRPELISYNMHRARDVAEYLIWINRLFLGLLVSLLLLTRHLSAVSN